MGRMIFSLNDKLEKRFRDYVKHKFGEDTKGALTIAASMALKEWLDKEGAVEINK